MAAGKAGSKVERVGELLCGRQQETRNPPRAFAGLQPRLSQAVSDMAAVGRAGWVSPGCSLAAGVRRAGLTAADGGGDPPPAAQGGHGARSPWWGQTVSCCTQLQGCAELRWVSAPEHCSDLHNIKLLMGFQCACVQVCVWSCVIIRSLWDPQTYRALLSSLSLPQKAN